MKNVFRSLFLAFAVLLLSGSASAWNCPTGQIRVQVPAGTSGAVVVEGLSFGCESANPPTGTANTNSNANQNSNSSSSKSESSSTSGAVSGSSSTATGGSVSNSGNSSSTSSIRDSGNSTAIAQGGKGGNANQKQGQSQGQTQSATANGNGVGNGNNSNNSVYNSPKQTATAYAPSIYPTVPCFKGMGFGVQGPMFGGSFGGGKIDQNCASLEASRQAPSLIARCKVYISIKAVREAGVTLGDCMALPEPAIVAPVIQENVVPTIQPVVINVPAPVVTVIQPQSVVQTPIVSMPPAVHQRHPIKPCVAAANKSANLWTNDNVLPFPEKLYPMCKE